MSVSAPWPWHQGAANPDIIYAADQMTVVVVCRDADTALEIVTAVNNMNAFTQAAKECCIQMRKGTDQNE